MTELADLIRTELARRYKPLDAAHRAIAQVLYLHRQCEPCETVRVIAQELGLIAEATT